MKRRLTFTSILAVLLLYGCDLCPLDDHRQGMVDKANSLYSDSCEVEYVDCQNYSIDVHLKNPSLSQLLLDSLHSILLRKGGWLVLYVYDSEGNYICSHDEQKNTRYYTIHSP